MPRRTKRTAGFTLIELIVAIAILLLLATSIYTSFSLGLRLRSDSQSRSARLQANRQLAALLREDLRNLAPVSPNLAVHDGRLSLLREADARHMRAAGRGTPPPRLIHITYGPAGTKDDAVLVRREHWLGAPRINSTSLTALLLPEPQRAVPSSEPTNPNGIREWAFPPVERLGLRAFTWEGNRIVEARNGVLNEPARFEFSIASPSDTSSALIVWLPRIAARASTLEDSP